MSKMMRIWTGLAATTAMTLLAIPPAFARAYDGASWSNSSESDACRSARFQARQLIPADQYVVEYSSCSCSVQNVYSGRRWDCSVVAYTERRESTRSRSSSSRPAPRYIPPSRPVQPVYIPDVYRSGQN